MPLRPVGAHHLVLQLVHGQRGGVDHLVGDLAEVGERLALGPDAVDDVALSRQRMPPPRLVVAAHQGLIGGLQEQHVDVVAAAP